MQGVVRRRRRTTHPHLYQATTPPMTPARRSSMVPTLAWHGQPMIKFPVQAVTPRCYPAAPLTLSMAPSTPAFPALAATSAGVAPSRSLAVGRQVSSTSAVRYQIRVGKKASSISTARYQVRVGQKISCTSMARYQVRSRQDHAVSKASELAQRTRQLGSDQHRRVVLQCAYVQAPTHLAVMSAPCRSSAPAACSVPSSAARCSPVRMRASRSCSRGRAVTVGGQHTGHDR